MPKSPIDGAPSEQVADLVIANRILYDQAVVDGFGHVSVRDERNPERFLLARSMAPALVTAADILEFGMDGEPLDAKGRGVYVERFIHSEIYRARPEVMAVVHSHSPNLIPFGITPQPLRPVYHMSGFLGAGAPVFDIRTVGGDTNMLVTDRRLGGALAKTLGEGPVALMRGHGSVAAGSSLRQAVYRAIYMEMNARIQAEALRLGPVAYLNERESELAALANDNAMTRPWELWRRRALGEG